MNCRKFEENLSDYVAGRLDPVETARLSAHCDSCANCARSLESERSLRELFSSAKPVLHTPDLWSQVSAQLAPRKQRFGFPRFWRATSGFALTAVAAAALLFTMLPKTTTPPIVIGQRTSPVAEQVTLTPASYQEISNVGVDESEYVYNHTRVAHQVGFDLPDER